MAAMSLTEASAAFDKLRASMGRDAYLTVHLVVGKHWNSDRPLLATAYPDGITRGESFTVHADTFDDLHEAIAAKWAEISAAHEQRTIRRMALEVIRITTDLGHCTDAALRAGEFSAADVRRFGERACAEATAMAANGPFSIRTAGLSNGAPVEGVA